MSVEVLSPGEGGSPGGSSRVGGLADDLYNLFLSKPTSTTASPLSATLVPGLAAPAAPAATGCAMNGVTKTIIVIGGVNGQMQRLTTALERTKPLADIARAKGNVVHHAFLGGALPPHGAPDEGVATWLVAVKTGARAAYDIDPANVHLIAGPREIQSLSTAASQPDSQLHEYLKLSKLVECLGPDSMDAEGRGGTWLKCAGTQAGSMVGKLPGVGVMGVDGPRAAWIDSPAPLTAVSWKDELNKRWAAATESPKKLKEELPNKWQFWMTLGVQSALDEEILPVEGLGTQLGGGVGVFSRPLVPFGSVRRTLSIDHRSLIMLPVQTWMDIGTSGDSLYWGVQTYCYNTMKAMNAHRMPMLDRTPSLAELQYDVSCTLGSLVQHSERANTLTPPTHPWANFGALRGQIGPCVCGGRDGQEVLRAVHWTGNGMPSVVMLLPEAYVRHVLSDYYTDLVGSVSMGARAVTGFLILEDTNTIPMRLPDVSEAEQMDAAKQLGARLWKMPATPNHATRKEVLDCMTAAPKPWRQILQYKVTGSEPLPDLVPGQRVDSAGNAWHMFYTHTSSADPLSGLMVRWAFAPGDEGARDMPTLDVDNTQFQTVV